ncbi:MAG: sulfotransferase family 2 domain-containing protein [Pseudomonadota bacterium]
METIDFDREALIFIHVPKAAGTALAAALSRAVGADRTIHLKQGKIENWRWNRWDERREEALTAMRLGWGAVTGRHALLPSRATRAEVDGARFLYGHIRLDQVPRTQRRPRVITVLRDPVDRFLSRYYYTFDRDARGRDAARKPSHDRRTGAVPETPEAFLDMMAARGTVTWRNGQCRFFDRSGSAAAALRRIAEDDVAVAPLPALPQFRDTLAAALPCALEAIGQVNVGAARRQRGTVTPTLRARIEDVFAEDVTLYRMAEAAFAKGGPMALARAG